MAISIVTDKAQPRTDGVQPEESSIVRDGVRRVCVVGPGTRFLSGITYYTFSLCAALSGAFDVSAVLMRQLLPTRLYPGRKRVGADIASLALPSSVARYDGVDWFWVPSLLRALWFLRRQRPDVLILQWWTGTVLHTYLALTIMARLQGARVVVEFHEVLDPGEARLPLVPLYVGALANVLMRLVDGFVVHSDYDKPALASRYRLGRRPVALIPHGPYDHYQRVSAGSSQRVVPESVCNLLFFGTIRPYKGLEDLVTAFDAIPEEEIDRYWLTVVGETWEGWTLPAEMIARSRYQQRITFVNRYVPDGDVAAFFAAADAVVLPYHRSSASGPLHVAMSYGLPVVVTRVGGLPEAAAAYGGAIFVPPGDPAALRVALGEAFSMRTKRFADPQSWDGTVTRYDALFAALGQASPVRR